MVQRYTTTVSDQQTKLSPSNAVINALLNYSKALEIKKIRKKRMLINLN